MFYVLAYIHLKIMKYWMDQSFESQNLDYSRDSFVTSFSTTIL